MLKALLRWLLLVLLTGLALQVFFIGRIALMRWVDPQSTTFERSQAWQILRRTGSLTWQQHWLGYGDLPATLKRAVIASEDGDFVHHHGVQWNAIQGAWHKNAQAQSQAVKRPQPGGGKLPKIVGGSTISQQLAKNLLLSGERTLVRKAQELVLTLALETLLGKRRMLEIYLNHVEWGQGVFGAEAAAQHYFRKPAARLSGYEAARLAVMLPRPKYFERLPHSAYLSGRAEVILARMGDAELP